MEKKGRQFNCSPQILARWKNFFLSETFFQKYNISSKNPLILVEPSEKIEIPKNAAVHQKTATSSPNFLTTDIAAYKFTNFWYKLLDTSWMEAAPFRMNCDSEDNLKPSSSHQE